MAAAAGPRFDVAGVMSVAEVGVSLGISEGGVVALANAGLLEWRAPCAISRPSVDVLAERLHRAALPTAFDAPGVRLRDAVDNAGAGASVWPAVIAALLDGRLNAFRRRGGFGAPIIAALVVSSEYAVAGLTTRMVDAGEAPFIWTPSS